MLHTDHLLTFIKDIAVYYEWYYFSALSSSCVQFLRCNSDIEEKKMARINEVLEFLRTLILSTTHDTLKVSKVSLTDIQVCLQNAPEKIDFLQLES